MSTDKCPKCGGNIRCLAGELAHADNWYCEDEQGCGWWAWGETRDPVAESDLPDLLAEAQEQERIASRAFADVKAELDQLHTMVSEYLEAFDEMMQYEDAGYVRVTNAREALRKARKERQK